MAKAGDKLFVMGPPDILDEKSAFTTRLSPSLLEQLEAQDQANDGRTGSLLRCVAADTGYVLAEQPFDDVPRWDGMAWP